MLRKACGKVHGRLVKESTSQPTSSTEVDLLRGNSLFWRTQMKLTRACGKVRGKLIKGANPKPAPSSEVDLHCGNADITRALWLHIFNLLVLTSGHGQIYTFTLDSSESSQLNPENIFQKHSKWVNDIAYITGAIVVTVDMEGNIKTWNACTGATISETRVKGTEFYSIERLSASKLVAGTRSGEIVIFSHENGKSLSCVDRKKAHSGIDTFVWDLAVFGEFFYTLSREGEITVWSRSYMEKIETLRIDEKRLARVEVNEFFIVVGSYEGTIHVYENRDGFKRVADVDFQRYGKGHPGWLHVITFISPKFIMACTTEGGTYFISLDSFKCVDHLPGKDKNRGRVSFIVGDGRICVAGNKGYGVLLRPPSAVKDTVKQYAERLKIPVLRLLPYSDPVQAAWVAIRNDGISIQDAIDLTVCSDFVRYDSREWFAAHLITMSGIGCGLIPSDRKYKGEEIFWWDNLYKYGSEFNRGNGDRNKMLKIIKEAEDARILGGGCAETIDVRGEMLTKASILEHCVWDLYTRVIATDKEVEKLMKYQNIQKKAALVNAIIACIPFVGGMSAYFNSGGAAVCDGLETSGIVESVFGASKDCLQIASEPVAARFLKSTDKVLKEENWKLIPFEQKEKVNCAARDLDLSILDLREEMEGLVGLSSSNNGIHRYLEVENGSAETIEVLDGASTARVSNYLTEASEAVRTYEEDQKNQIGELKKENRLLRTENASQEREISALKSKNVVQEEKIITLMSENSWRAP